MTDATHTAIARKLQDLLYRFTGAMESGGDVAAAFDSVMGEGAYDRFVSDLYDSLRQAA
jgi:hypothetical protein